MKETLFFILIIVLAIGIPAVFKYSRYVEGYVSLNLAATPGEFPKSQTDVLVQDFYPPIGKNQLSTDGANDIWWHRPIFKVGSYAQITNNIKYPNNPDVGSCTPAGMCGALYHENQEASNYVKPLPPVNPECGTRVGYYSTDENLLYFRTNEQNILY
jgi:hypothetical protein